MRRLITTDVGRLKTITEVGSGNLNVRCVVSVTTLFDGLMFSIIEGAIDTHLLVVVENLPAGVELTNAEGTGSSGAPFVRLFLDDDGGTLQPGNTITTELNFT